MHKHLISLLQHKSLNQRSGQIYLKPHHTSAYTRKLKTAIIIQRSAKTEAQALYLEDVLSRVARVTHTFN